MKNLMRQSGFTLVELIMVIVIMGIIAGIVSVFMKSPIDAYFASGRRAALTDTADTTVRRMARDIQRALPNSIGTSGDNLCVEFIPTKTGGRYRAADSGALSFSSVGSTFFNVFGNYTSSGAISPALPVDQQIRALDFIVLYNLGLPGTDGLDAYSGTNIAQVTNVGSETTGTPPETQLTVNILAAVNTTFTFNETDHRFQVIPANEKVVAYVCSGTNLYRVARTTLAHICPAPGDVTASPRVATNVDCTGTSTSTSSRFNYSGSDLHRNALISMRLQLTDDSGESVTLQHEVHVSNTP